MQIWHVEAIYRLSLLRIASRRMTGYKVRYIGTYCTDSQMACAWEQGHASARYAPYEYICSRHLSPLIDL
jgi:hypothetical protein